MVKYSNHIVSKLILKRSQAFSGVALLLLDMLKVLVLLYVTTNMCILCITIYLHFRICDFDD